MIKLGFKTLFYLFGRELNKLDINFSLYSIIEKNRGALGIAGPFLTRRWSVFNTAESTRR